MKKWIMLVISIIVIIFIGFIIVLFLNSKESPKKVIEQFITAYNKQDVDAIIECIDFAGADSWYYDEENFSEDDYSDFIEECKEYSESDINEDKIEIREYLNEDFSDMNEMYKQIKLEIDDFKTVEEIGNNLYTIKVVISGTTISNDENKKETESTLETFKVHLYILFYLCIL